jgi:hypothetical protein
MSVAREHSIFFMKHGHAIHGSYEVKNLGSRARRALDPVTIRPISAGPSPATITIPNPKLALAS